MVKLWQNVNKVYLKKERKKENNSPFLKILHCITKKSEIINRVFKTENIAY